MIFIAIFCKYFEYCDNSPFICSPENPFYTKKKQSILNLS